MGYPTFPTKTKRHESKAAKDPARSTKDGHISKQPPLEKKHAEYREHYLRSGVIRCLKYGGHDATEVVLDAIKSFTVGHWSAEQREAIRQIEAAVVRWSPPPPQNTTWMTHINVFNDLFFLGKLNRLMFRWRDLGGEFGECVLSHDSGIPTAWIAMDPKDRHAETHDRDHRASLIGTMLHELCYAFVDMYSCCGDCNGLNCVAGQATTLGDTGHAKAWFLLAASVQTVARRAFPQLDVRLGIFTSLRKEHRSSRYVLGGAEWDELFNRFSRDEMLDLLAELREHDWERITEAYHRESLVYEKLKRTWNTKREEVRKEQGEIFHCKGETWDVQDS